MTLYLHQPMPVALPNLPNVYVKVQSTLNLLAVHEAEQAFRASSTADLALCTKQGSTYLCPRANVKAIRPPTTQTPKSEEACLIALFLRNWEVANKTCTQVAGPLTDEVIQVGPNAFMSYSKDHHRGTISCARGIQPPGRDFQAGGRDYAYIPDGCVGRTWTHEFTGTVSITGSPSHSKAYDWPTVYDEVFAANAEQIRKMRLMNAAQESPLAAAKAHLKLMEDAAAHQASQRWVHPNTTSSITLMLLLALLGLGLYGFSTWFRNQRAARQIQRGHRQEYDRQRGLELESLYNQRMDDHCRRVADLRQEGRHREATHLERNPPQDPADDPRKAWACMHCLT